MKGLNQGCIKGEIISTVFKSYLITWEENQKREEKGWGKNIKHDETLYTFGLNFKNNY